MIELKVVDDSNAPSFGAVFPHAKAWDQEDLVEVDLIELDEGSQAAVGLFFKRFLPHLCCHIWVRRTAGKGGCVDLRASGPKIT